MLIPYGSDAPLHYRPFATIGLIAVNAVVFALQWNESIDTEKWALRIGSGFHPLQWVTANFLHADWLHLIANMVFLWVFGMIVEGKTGSWLFLGIYFALGIGESALEQVLFLHSEEGITLGASAILYGLLGMSAVWAPKNDVQFLFIYFRAAFFELSVLTTAGIYIGLDLLGAFFWMGMGKALSTSTIHLLGAVIGLVAGVVLLKRGVVDCENWDWFSIRAGRHIPVRIQKPKPVEPRSPRTASDVTEERRAALELLRESLAAGDAPTAWEIYSRTAEETGGWLLGEKDSRALVTGLHAAAAWESFATLAQAHIARFAAGSASIRLGLAEHTLRRASRPSRALAMLDALPDASLTPAEIVRGDRARAEAERRIQGGALELADD